MAITGISFSERNEYICQDDPCPTKEEGATVFYWSAIPNLVITKLTDAQQFTQVNMNDATQVFKQNTANRNRECFRRGVKGWENFADKHGNPIIFRTEKLFEDGRNVDVIPESVLDCILGSTISEVGNHIYTNNTLSETGRKNFEALLSQLGGSPSLDAGNVTTTTKNIEDAPSQPETFTPATEASVNTGTTHSMTVGKAPVLDD